MAWGEDPDPAPLSSYFMTREELIALCQDEDGNWLSGENSLLANGEATPVRIAFGRRPQREHYLNKNNEDTDAPKGPISWLVAGGEDCEDGSAGLVLWSEEPLIGCDELNKGNRETDGLSSIFSSSNNVWESSNLRTVLQKLTGDGQDYFTEDEVELMEKSTIKTGTANALTEDYLYAPRNIELESLRQRRINSNKKKSRR